MAVEVMELDPERTEFEFSGTDQGRKGDVPVMRLSTKRSGPLVGPTRCRLGMRCGPHWSRCSRRSLREDSHDDATGSSTSRVSDRDGVINRPVLRRGRPHRPASLGELGDLSRRCHLPRPVRGRRIHPGGRDESARRRKENATQRGGPRHQPGAVRAAAGSGCVRLFSRRCRRMWLPEALSRTPLRSAHDPDSISVVASWLVIAGGTWRRDEEQGVEPSISISLSNPRPSSRTW